MSENLAWERMCIPSNFQDWNGKKWLCEAFLHLKRISESTCSKSENAVTKRYLPLAWVLWPSISLPIQTTKAWLSFTSYVITIQQWLWLRNDRICLSRAASEDWNEGKKKKKKFICDCYRSLEFIVWIASHFYEGWKPRKRATKLPARLDKCNSNTHLSMQIQYAVHGEISYLRVINRVIERRLLLGNHQEAVSTGATLKSFFLPGIQSLQFSLD